MKFLRASSVAVLVVSMNAFLASRQAAVREAPSLKDVFRSAFYVGAALNERQFSGQDERGAAIVRAQFNSITPENVLKWERVHPDPGRFDFAAADRYVAFGERNGMRIIGHTLIWHHQTPEWVFHDSSGKRLTRESLLERMHDHIAAVVGRYKGRIAGWDVVNEALNEDGTLRNSPWREIIGDEYIERAFQFAHEADSSAELYYNDYSLENKPKRDGACALIRKLQAEGIPVAAIGLQGHYKMTWPSGEQIDTTVTTFSRLGIRVMVTELDIDVVPASQKNKGADLDVNHRTLSNGDIYASGLPDSVQTELAMRYGSIFGILLRHPGEIERVTFWGVTDGDSWLNSPGRTNYPLLFDRAGNPKPAFYAVVKSASR